MKIKEKLLLAVLAGLGLGFIMMIALCSVYTKSSTNDSCTSCHYHPEADMTYKKSVHFNSASGVKTDCAECHLPPKGTSKRFFAKVKTGGKDLVSYVFKKPEDIDFQSKKTLEYAPKIVYNESCSECHVNLFPEGVVDDAIVAHLYYQEHQKELDLQCINCHLDVGHYNPGYNHGRMTGVPTTSSNTGNRPPLLSIAGSLFKKDVYDDTPFQITEFADYTERIPGTYATINMKAVPGGTFLMGSPADEPMRNLDEGPQKSVSISSFFMAETEVTWDQYWAFYQETMSEGRISPDEVKANNDKNQLDAISGPTPPFGAPDQGWGMGDRPAITMTWYAARTFCQWLSLKTGKTYRLPTEAEWEYAARGGTTTAYFFGGNPKSYSSIGILKGIFKPDTTVINSYAVYANNSHNHTGSPSQIGANPFGLKNMSGNVMEYCSDWYAADAYSAIKDGEVDPKGPKKGTEHVVRGGQYSDDASALRSAARSSTMHDAWLKTDPQSPKSIWWYSDIKGIGFRIVCEVPENIKN